jgi:Cdc6-like AAA superfamily ATPase
MSENGSTATLCLYGNTGCGKTSLIVKVLDFFGSNFHTVRKVYLNCMNMLNTGQIYGTILSGLFGLR